MSEYQYYEFVAVDRPLDDRQLLELRALSTRAAITRSSFVNTYEWGNFRGNPRTLMAKYFDAYLYVANWGTRELMLRLPARLLTLDAAERYCVGDAATAWVSGDQVIVSLTSEDEEGDWEHGGEGWLASIVPARAELAAGELRTLYLGWLLSAQTELDRAEVEPPVPPDLGALTAAQRSLVDFLRIDPDLLAVAATASRASEPSPLDDGLARDLDRWVEDLPTAEKNVLLRRVLRDEPHLRAELLRRFHGEPAADSTAGERTVGQLLSAADARRQEREQVAANDRAERRARRERQAEIARDKHLESLASREEQAWQQVSRRIETKKPSEYDDAVRLLQDLQAIGERRHQSKVFEHRLAELRLQHQRKPSLLQRLDRAGLTAVPPATT